MNKLLVLAIFVFLMRPAYADQGSFTNSGGSTSTTSGVTISSNVTTPAGTLDMNCPATGADGCAGGSFTFLSNDGTISINATFTSGTATETCSGGGRGGHITCGYSLTAYLSGTLTVNAATQAIVGGTSQSFTVGHAASGITGYNSAYTPFYFTDGNARILRADDLRGSNAIAYGTQGSGVGQFYGPSGIALDASGRIYITDTYNDRIVRIDDLSGTNWTSFGTYGSGVGQFATPQSLSIDPAGHIWVLDNGNSRLVRMDDMNGTNWTTLGTTGGSGVGHFAGLSSAPGFDSLGRIYLADSGNGWIVRFDDLNFTNWTTTPPLGAVTGVAVDPAGKIYAADFTPPSVIRVDDMTGANRTSVSLGTFPANTIAIDSTGMVLLGNGYNAQIDDSQAAVLTSNIDGVVLVNGVYVTVYGAVPISLPSPPPSAISFSPATLTFSQNVGTTSPPQTITISNFGGSPLNISSVSANGGFTETDNCAGQQIAGSSNCTVSVTFAPSGPGPVSGLLTVTNDSGNLGAAQTVSLTGTGIVPVSPTPTWTPTSDDTTTDTPTPTQPIADTPTATTSPPPTPTPMATTTPGGLTTACLTGTAPEVMNDPSQIRAVRVLVDARCPCASFDGSTGRTHGDYVTCAGSFIKAQVPGGLRQQCAGTVKKFYAQSTCGRNPTLHAAPCIQAILATGKITCVIKRTTMRDGITPTNACADTATASRVSCPTHTTCIDAADTNGNLIIAGPGDSGTCAP